jgi:hypothetical protein
VARRHACILYNTREDVLCETLSVVLSENFFFLLFEKEYPMSVREFKKEKLTRTFKTISN